MIQSESSTAFFATHIFFKINLSIMKLNFLGHVE
jgi:hypothetical protein